MRAAVTFSLFFALVACSSADVPQSNEAPSVDGVSVRLEPPRTDPVLANTPLGLALKTRLLSGPTLAAARAGEAVALAQLADQRAAVGPSLSLGASAAASTGSDPALQPTARLSQLVYDGGASDFAIDASVARADAAAATTETRVTSRALDAVRAWEDVHRAEELVRIAMASLDRTIEIEEGVALRLSSGAGRAAETLRVAARRADAAATLARAEGELSAAKARFTELLGAAAASGPVPLAPANSADIDASPRLRELRAEANAARSDLNARRAERAPGVFFDVTAGLDGDDDPALGAGLRLDYAVDISGRRDAAIAAAQAEVDRLEAELVLAESDLQRALTDAKSRETALKAERDAVRSAEAAAARALADAEASFATGRVDLIDLLDLGQDLDQAASRRVDVEAQYRLSGYVRLAVAGVLLDVFGISVSGADG